MSAPLIARAVTAALVVRALIVAALADALTSRLVARLDERAFTCPRCGMTSYHPDDAREGYCANCHDWTRGRT